MKKLVLLMSIFVGACTSQNSKELSTAALIEHDQACSTIHDEKDCVADTTDHCRWEPLPTPVNAGGVSLPAGVCVGDPGVNPCAIIDQCSNITDQATCDVLANCQWTNVACPVANNNNNPGGIVDPIIVDPICPPQACEPKNPCANLTVATCASNPQCEVVAAPCEPVACPAIICAGTNCPPVNCTPVTCEDICVQKEVSCETPGGTGSGNGSGSTGGSSGSGNGSGTTTGNGGGTSSGNGGGTTTPPPPGTASPL